MIPQAATALKLLSQRIMTRLVPDARTPYAMADGAMVGLLLGGLSAELEEGIERRLQDIEAMRVVFRLALVQLPAGALKEHINGLLAKKIRPLTLTAVNAVHDNCTRVLISLHELAETEVESYPGLAPVIWRYLEEQAQRHRLNI